MRDTKAFVDLIGYEQNGRGVHYISHPYQNDAERWASCLEEMGVTGTTVIDPELQVLQTLKRHGISLVIYRSFRRAYQPFTNNGNPVQTMQAAGYVPIIQVNNEDELSEEWDGQPINWMVSAVHLLNASIQVYSMGGIVAWQMVDTKYLEYCIDLALSPEWNCGYIFDKFVFIPHNYGLNHPEWYDEDDSCFLGFLWYAKTFEKKLGFVPPFIPGEWGWCVDNQDDNRFPKLNEALVSLYTARALESFQAGVLPGGRVLPDWLIGCIGFWVLGSTVAMGDMRFEAASIYKGNGTRMELFINSLKAMANKPRLYSWQKKEEEPKKPMATLAEQYPELFAGWQAAGGDAEESFRFYLMATGRLEASEQDRLVLAERIKAHVGELVMIGAQLLPKNP